MELKLNYDELEKYIQAHYGQTVLFARVDDRILKVSYVKKVIITMTVSVKLKVIDVADSQLLVSVDSSTGFDSLISRVLKFVSKRFPELTGGLSEGPDHSISVDLKKIEKAKPVTESLQFQSIRFEDSHLTLTASLK